VDILHEKGWHHFFVFYDEANRLPLDLSVDIVASNEEALCAAGVVNAYSTAPNASVLSQFTGVFGHQIRLRPFQSVDDLRELLYRYYFPNEKKTCALPATENAILAVWEMSRAQPYQIQLLAGNAFRLAHEEGSNLLHSRHVLTVAEVLRKELPHVFDYLDRR
jgi:hypothetical protein